MDTVYSFITAKCKERDMKIEDLQRALGFSRSTLYRLMKGIHEITKEFEPQFVKALNLDVSEALEFSRLISQSVHDRSLIESRYEIDKFLFCSQQETVEPIDIELVFYNNDRYLRTLREVFSLILSYRDKPGLKGTMKIVNCLDSNLFSQLSQFMQRMFSEGWNVDVEHFVGLSEDDYLQNAVSFVHIFPLISHDQYNLFYRETKSEDMLLDDSILMSLSFEENGQPHTQYLSLSFFEQGLPECILFSDPYMFLFLDKYYVNLKHLYNNTVQKFNQLSFDDIDLYKEFTSAGEYIIKPNPCYDKIPLAVYESQFARASADTAIQFFREIYHLPVTLETLPQAVAQGLRYMDQRIESSYGGEQLDVYTCEGLRKLAETGLLSDHLPYLPPFSPGEVKEILIYLRERDKDPTDSFRLYIVDKSPVRKDFIAMASRDLGMIIDYVYPAYQNGIHKSFVIRSKRLAAMFCDYMENHVPVHHAMDKESAHAFLNELIERL